MDGLQNLYGGRPVYCAYEPAVQQAVVSRYRVESSAAMKEKGQAQKAVLWLAGGPITVFNVHPLRSGGWRQRYGQIASLLEEEVLREKTPVILGGDFNAPDHSQLYKLVAGHLKNAHREAGLGFGFTYPSSDVRVLRLFPLLPWCGSTTSSSATTSSRSERDPWTSPEARTIAPYSRNWICNRVRPTIPRSSRWRARWGASDAGNRRIHLRAAAAARGDACHGQRSPPGVLAPCSGLRRHATARL